MNDFTNEVRDSLESMGYDFAVAVATQAEIEAGAACGQLSLILEKSDKKSD
jgi:hypothetical protein